MTAPLTLDEVRKAPERELLCWDDVNDLVATIEWLAERVDALFTGNPDVCWTAREDLGWWLRGEA